MKSISPCLSFDHQAEEAVQFYETVFKNVRRRKTAYYPPSGSEATGCKAGSVMTVSFQLEDTEFLALNGGPAFQITQALSFS